MLYAFPLINRFPKAQRFVLAQQIQNAMVDIARLIVQANKQRNKLPTLYQIDVELEKLRLLIRLAKDLNLLAVKQYGLMSERINEVGRLLGGWIKSQSPG